MVKHTTFQIILTALQEFGVLMETDRHLPSVATLVAGEVMRGSWWSHKNAQQIFEVLEAVASSKDVTITKLLSGKVTFVHRKLWPLIISIGRSRQTWQTSSMTASGELLLAMIDVTGTIFTNELEWPRDVKTQRLGDTVRDLEKRLLIHAEEFHTAAGAHAKRLETWETWANRQRFAINLPPVNSAKRSLEKTVAEMNSRFSANATLPWRKQ